MSSGLARVEVALAAPLPLSASGKTRIVSGGEHYVKQNDGTESGSLFHWIRPKRKRSGAPLSSPANDDRPSASNFFPILIELDVGSVATE